MPTKIDVIEKLIALAAHTGGNENEKIAAALRACDIIYKEKIPLGRSGRAEYGRVPDYQPSQNDKLKEFYQKLVFFNGKPYELINQRLKRCSLCRGTLHIGDIIVWIPKTTHTFHPACWSTLKIKVTR